jgi:3-hydroxybutyryl-CoA dehydratase
MQTSLPDGTLHVGQEIDNAGSAQPEEPLTLRTRVAQRSERQGMVVVAVEFEVEGGAGPVLRAKSTIMSPGGPVGRDITQTRIDAYAEAAQDHNPIHIDPAYAATTPLGGTIAHGMLVLALIGELMHGAHGEQWLRTGRLKVRFVAPTPSGETVTALATPSKEADGLAEYVVQCQTSAGQVVIEGRASVRVSP